MTIRYCLLGILLLSTLTGCFGTSGKEPTESDMTKFVKANYPNATKLHVQELSAFSYGEAYFWNEGIYIRLKFQADGTVEVETARGELNWFYGKGGFNNQRSTDQ